MLGLKLIEFYEMDPNGRFSTEERPLLYMQLCDMI